MALLLALARNVPQPQARWSRAAGTARSSPASRCTTKCSASSASAASVSSSRTGLAGRHARRRVRRVHGRGTLAELGVERASVPRPSTRWPTSSRCTCRRTPSAGLPRRQGVRGHEGTERESSTSRAARWSSTGPEGRARLRQGGRSGARRLPRGADHRASTARLPERRGHPAPRRLDHRGDGSRRFQAAEQVVAAPPVHPSPPPSTSRRSRRTTCWWLSRSLGLCLSLGRIAADSHRHLAGGAGDRVPRPRRRARRPAVDDPGRQGCVAGPYRGGHQRRQRPDSGGRARHRRLDHRRPVARDFTDLVRVTIRGGRAIQLRTARNGHDPRRRHGARAAASPHLLEAWGSASTCSLTAPRGVPLPRPARDAGTHRHAFGDAGITSSRPPSAIEATTRASRPS